jgi:hypothetical protein
MGAFMPGVYFSIFFIRVNLRPFADPILLPFFYLFDLFDFAVNLGKAQRRPAPWLSF